MFGGFARRDQRARDELYLRGLMLDGKRKSMQPMAERLGVKDGLGLDHFEGRSWLGWHQLSTCVGTDTTLRTHVRLGVVHVGSEHGSWPHVVWLRCLV